MFSKFFAIAIFALCLPLATAHAEKAPDDLTLVNPPKALPAFVFEDVRSRQMRLDDFKGHPILLNLWATWCGPCVQELPSLDQLQHALADTKLVVIALDQEHHGADAAAAYFKQHEIQHLAIYSDSGRTASLLHARGLPMSYLIDANGMLCGTVAGSTDWMAPDMISFLRARLVPALAVPE